MRKRFAVMKRHQESGGFGQRCYWRNGAWQFSHITDLSTAEFHGLLYQFRNLDRTPQFVTDPDKTEYDVLEFATVCGRRRVSLHLKY
jgi:hypothetical protein